MKSYTIYMASSELLPSPPIPTSSMPTPLSFTTPQTPKQPWQQGSWGQHGPIWGRQDPGGPHVCPMNFAIWEGIQKRLWILNIRALNFCLNEIHTFQSKSKIFWVEFQRVPLKFHTKYLTHLLKDMLSILYWNFMKLKLFAFWYIHQSHATSLS